MKTNRYLPRASTEKSYCRSSARSCGYSLLAWCCNRNWRRTRSPCLLGGVWSGLSQRHVVNRRTIVATGPNLLLTCTHDRSFQGCFSLDSGPYGLLYMSRYRNPTDVATFIGISSHLRQVSLNSVSVTMSVFLWQGKSTLVLRSAPSVPSFFSMMVLAFPMIPSSIVSRWKPKDARHGMPAQRKTSF